MKPRLTKKVADGLAAVLNLAMADAESDPERYPPQHPIWSALGYLDRLEQFEKQRRMAREGPPAAGTPARGHERPEAGA